MEIHPVISVAQLEPKTPGQDPYNRPRPHHPDSIHVEGDTETMKSWEIERIIDKRIRKSGKKKITEYQIRWLGYGPEHDMWYTPAQLENSMELIEAFEKTLPKLPKISKARKNPGRARI